MSLVAPTITGWSGFWANILVAGQAQGGTYNFQGSQNRTTSANRISREMKRGSNRDAIGALAALIGANAGGTATNQYRRRQAPAQPSGATPQATGFSAFGGNIPIELISAINRVTTSADVTELKKWFDNTLLEAGITYPSVLGNNVANGTQIGGTGRF